MTSENGTASIARDAVLHRAPKVSIGLPVFNGEDFIVPAIKSILAQSYSDFELIICDNASTDRTGQICAEFAALDPRVRYLRQETNLGAAKNYNRAFNEAGGTYFKWASHDDNLSPNFLDRCVEELEKDAGLFLVHAVTVTIDAAGEKQSCYLDCMETQSDCPVARFQTWMEKPTGQCNPVFGLLRRVEMAKTGLHGDYIGADRILLGEFALRGRTKTVRDAFFYRRIHPNISTKANINALDLTAWFNGRRTSGLRFKRWRQLREFAWMICRVPLTPRQRIGALRVLLKWVRQLRREFTKELLIPFYINGQDTRLKRWMRRQKARRSQRVQS